MIQNSSKLAHCPSHRYFTIFIGIPTCSIHQSLGGTCDGIFSTVNDIFHLLRNNVCTLRIDVLFYSDNLETVKSLIDIGVARSYIIDSWWQMDYLTGSGEFRLCKINNIISYQVPPPYV